MQQESKTSSTKQQYSCGGIFSIVAITVACVTFVILLLLGSFGYYDQPHEIQDEQKVLEPIPEETQLFLSPTTIGSMEMVDALLSYHGDIGAREISVEPTRLLIAGVERPDVDMGYFLRRVKSYDCVAESRIERMEEQGERLYIIEADIDTDCNGHIFEGGFSAADVDTTIQESVDVFTEKYSLDPSSVLHESQEAGATTTVYAVLSIRQAMELVRMEPELLHHVSNMSFSTSKFLGINDDIFATCELCPPASEISFITPFQPQYVRLEFESR